MTVQDNNLPNLPSRPLWADFIMIACLSISLACNVVLGWKVRSLLAIAPPPSARIGMQLTGIKAKKLSGEPISLSFSTSEPTVLYVFRPTCKWCAANIKNIQSLSTQRTTKEHFIGISISADGLSAYLKSMPLPFPVYIIDDQSELKNLSFVGTPQTIEISRDGKIIQNWVGAYSGDTAISIRRNFAVTLPRFGI